MDTTKTAGWHASALYLEKVNMYEFARSRKLDDMIKETEKIYIDIFAGGQRHRGMNALRLPQTRETHHFASWRAGLYMGLALPVFIRICQFALDTATAGRLPTFAMNLQIYACFFVVLLFCLAFGLNLAVWTHTRINYRFIFEFDARDTLDFHQFFELPAFLLFLLVYIAYFDFSSTFGMISSQTYPILFFCIAGAILLCPFPIFYYTSRRWLGIALARIFASGWFRVEFRDFFIADELNSLSYSFWTFGYFVCAYDMHTYDIDGTCNVYNMWMTPFVAALPAWWRLLQCLRRYYDSRDQVHLVNAGKYLSSVLAFVLVGPNRIIAPPSATPAAKIIWIIASSINSIYTSGWDILMDWSLFNRNSKYPFLRNELVFRPWIYYVAIITNIPLRFAWVVNLWRWMLNYRLLVFIAAILEVYRRIQWNFFRLENEHLNNVGHFRAIQEIPLPFNVVPAPSIHFNTNISGAETHSSQQPPGTSAASASPSTSRAKSTFYGSRDFENRREEIDEDKKRQRGLTFGIHRTDSESDLENDNEYMETGGHAYEQAH
ncbi:hypothetical protein BC937DRAFT_93502 [Endogone sp. FLAS-F59071]|nr:hypothetical protein BC937DRAFT_93502 [Endogone sp. FLAS-F59071]|eukprot:RUS14655.1 hypothetical protein BC937DRAFT_93502 [Endogone sp. FLAS-F59071]